MVDTTRRVTTTRPNATDATRHDAPVVVTTVAHAAEVLGISQGAVRKRIERGQLSGRKVDGQWRVFLNATDTTGHDASHATTPDNATTTRDQSHDQAQTQHDTSRAPVVSAAAQSQLDAFRDAILRPHLERIEALAKDVGRLTAERDQSRAELDAAISDRDKAAQRLTSDRALIDMMAAEIDTKSQFAIYPSSTPTPTASQTSPLANKPQIDFFTELPWLMLSGLLGTPSLFDYMAGEGFARTIRMSLIKRYGAQRVDRVMKSVGFGLVLFTIFLVSMVIVYGALTLLDFPLDPRQWLSRNRWDYAASVGTAITAGFAILTGVIWAGRWGSKRIKELSRHDTNN